MMRYFVNWQCSLFSSPRVTGTKVYTLPLGAYVEVVQGNADFAQVMYSDRNGYHEGYVERRFVEEYQRNLPFNVVDVSDIETSDPLDLAQYVNWKGVREVNMCGELCLAQYFGVKLSDVLVNWEGKKPAFFKRIFSGRKATGTSADDLIGLYELYGTAAEKIRLPRWTPTAARDLASAYHLTCGVKMNANGELRGGSIRHWVVLKEVVLERKFMGFVTVYNPANNGDEVYSWDEWTKAAFTPSGVMVRNG